jgi:hypothetical protein
MQSQHEHVLFFPKVLLEGSRSFYNVKTARWAGWTFVPRKIIHMDATRFHSTVLCSEFLASREARDDDSSVVDGEYRSAVVKEHVQPPFP